MSPSAQERHGTVAVDVGGNVPIEVQSVTDTAAEEGSARQVPTLRGSMLTANFKQMTVDSIKHRYGTGPQHAIEDA